ncbi:MAG: DinB family protein [Gemmatimonadota bacterium]
MTTVATFRRPAADEYAPYYARYIDRVPEGGLIDLLDGQTDVTSGFLASIPEERAGYRYAPEKWSVRQIVGHMADVERIMAYRALWFSRGATAPLPGFDEKVFVAGSNFDQRTLPDLAAEYLEVRRATLALFRGLDPEVGERRGQASGADVSVRALGYIISGHELHHLEVIRTRYL